MLTMIVVFKTDVWDATEAAYLVRRLEARLPGARINFDLYDVDKVLRIEGAGLCVELIRTLLDAEGCRCEELV